MIRHVAVVDIGKTNAKVAVVDLERLSETVVAKTSNRVLPGPPYPHFDIDALWAFILEGLGRTAGHDPQALVVTTHGASAVLVDAVGDLALPMLDYEHDGPDTLAADYDAVRPPFAETGSPRLPLGLNVGAQLFWQARTFRDDFARVAQILTTPQYWTSRLTGEARIEGTSIGCHTDLWDPQRRDFSKLVDTMSWRALMPPLSRADERLGVLKPEIAARTGLPADLPVHSGIHDSNASLYPHLIARKPPFAVVSTGTWVIVMAVGAATGALDRARDTLVNVNALGDPVPSARFMGGREFATMLGDRPAEPVRADIDAVLDGTVLLLPSIEASSGPFPGRTPAWIGAEPDAAGQRAAAVSFYLALMTATCLDLIHAQGDVIVEGPFAGNASYLAMLAAATGRPVRASAAGTGTSIGAALLCRPNQIPALDDRLVAMPNERYQAYAQRWRAAVTRATAPA